MQYKDHMEIDRSAKAVFDAAAKAYDTYRPGYPEAAIEAMIRLSGLRSESRLLEVGCGTGQATLPMARRGFHIDAIELGANLAAIARKKCARWARVHISNGAFETYKPFSDLYDLIYFAQSFPWIDPIMRLEKTAGLLVPGGSLSLLHNCTLHLDGILAVLGERLREVTNGLMGPPPAPSEMDCWRKELLGSGLFRNIVVLEYPWDCSYGTHEYKGLFRTYSDFRSMSADMQRVVEDTIAQTIEENGGTVVRHYVCVLVHAVTAR